MVAQLLLVLLALAPYHLDHESAADRYARMTVVAQSIDAATLEATCTGPFESANCKPTWPATRPELAALLVTIGWHETAFARHVGAGACKPWECDGGRARHYWQTWANPWVSRQTWNELEGLGYVPTTKAAAAAASVLGAGRRRCGSSGGAIAFYAVSRCSWPGAARRARMALGVVAQLRSGVDPGSG